MQNSNKHFNIDESAPTPVASSGIWFTLYQNVLHRISIQLWNKWSGQMWGAK